LRSADEGALVCDAANDSALADGMLAVEARRA
jgi:hypothetical protein